MGSKMKFSYEDYIKLLHNGQVQPPVSFSPYNSINVIEYSKLEIIQGKNKNGLEKTFRGLKSRVSPKYYSKIYPNQSRVLDYSQQSFPSYRFILPEILTEDWLGIVDWHKYQRDHGLHQPMCSYIVLKLLDQNMKPEMTFGGKSLLDMCYSKLKVSMERSNFYLREYLILMGIEQYSDANMWLNLSNENLWKALFVETAHLASVFHDLGYPWQYINSLNNKLVNVGVIKNEISNECDSLIKLFGDRLLFSPFNNYVLSPIGIPITWDNKKRTLINRALNETHGLPGAIGFLYLYDLLSDYPNKKMHPIRQFCVEWAAMAIMMHDLCKLYWGTDKSRTTPENPHLRINFENDPLSFIVTLADLIQEFERPDAIFADSSQSDVKVKYRFDCNSTELSMNKDYDLKIIYKYDDPHLAVKKNYHITDGKENEHHFDPQYGYLDYCSLGIRSIEMRAE
jgi:hypothetical protein